MIVSTPRSSILVIGALASRRATLTDMLGETADFVVHTANSIATGAHILGASACDAIILDTREGTDLDVGAIPTLRRLAGSAALLAVLPLMEGDEAGRALRIGADRCLLLEQQDAASLAATIRAVLAAGPRRRAVREPHVMIVEDEPATAEILSRFIAWRGYRVTAVPNGRHALERLRGDPADIVITDLDMPMLDGESLIAELKSASNRPPVIVVTGNPISELTWSRLRRSVVELYLKPLNLREIGQTVDRIVGTRAA